MTADRDFLFWMHERLIHRYNEHPNTDFVLKLRSIAEVTPEGRDTPATFPKESDRNIPD